MPASLLYLSVSAYCTYDVFIICYTHTLHIGLVYLMLDTREGNGTALQYSCLENPRERGASWAAIYGVTQSWTQLK